MAVSVLVDLNQELTRLFAAGSRLGAGDPRLKKLIAPLKKYGEKAPVFQKLAALVEELLDTDASQSAQKLIETEAFLLSVLSTQGDPLPSDATAITLTNHTQNSEMISETCIGYRTLAPVLEALTTTGSSRMETIKDAFEKGVFKDPRLYKASVMALGDKYSEIADYMANTVLPSMGEAIYPFLMAGYNVKGGSTDSRRLAVMHKIKGRQMLSLAEEATESGAAPVKAEAVKILSEYPGYEATFLHMLDECKTVREEAMKALVKTRSKKGIDRLLHIFKGDKSGTVMDALSSGTGDYLTDELLKMAYADYAAMKKVTDDLYNTSQTADATATAAIQKVRDDIRALKNKNTDDTAAYFKTLLTEDYLMKAESVFPKDKKLVSYDQSLEDSALEALYYSGKGNDFIWEMFKATQESFLEKIVKVKKKRKKDIPSMLYGYAFGIGAKTLSADEFYNIFFKTHLYKDIVQNDRHAFKNAFLGEGNRPAFSKKIARYFAEFMNDHHVDLAAKIVSADDHETLNLLAERLRINLDKNVYGLMNYTILKRLGETRNKNFKELYALYCAKGHGALSDRAELEQFLNT